MRRREALKVLGAFALAGCQSHGASPRMHVVVVGAGFGGTTAAKYLRVWSGGAITVTLVDPAAAFVSCPLSNLVVGGSRTLTEITQSYDGLAAHGVVKISDTVAAIDPGKREVRLQQGRTLHYDRLVLSPGISFAYERIAGLTPDARAAMPHAWKAGWQTTLLRRYLEAMPDGGVFVMAIPAAPYRCPPGPYERASQVAHYLKARKPRSKVILLDANAQIVSKGPLFTRAWKEDYPGLIEHRPNAAVVEVDPRTRTLVTADGEHVRADVANVIPPQRAGRLAVDAALVSAGWCEVDWRTQESVKAPRVHVIGDATLSAPGMPKSGHMANQHGKSAAAAIVELEAGRVPPVPLMVNTCYSFIDDRNAIRVSSVHQWVEGKRTLEPVPGAGGVTGPDRAQWALEGHYAAGWARTIWADMLA